MNTKGYYAAAEPLDTPYAPARAAYDSSIGAPTVSAYHWRLAFFALALPLMAAVCGLIYRAGENKIEPVYVGIDSLGQARVLESPAAQSKPSDNSVAFHLRQFVIHVWSVSSDAGQTKKNWIEAFHFASVKGQQQLKAEPVDAVPGSKLADWLDMPAELSQKGTAVVDAGQPLRITGDSWQVDWVRTPRDINGKPGKPTKYRGTFRLVTIAPKTAKDVMHNPLGIYVDEFHRIEL